MEKKWIQKALPGASKGKLRKELHIKTGEKIPLKKLDKAAKSSDSKLAKRAVLAKTLRGLRK